ncbi:MAG: amidohydrolase family protein [Anaerolineae bacterium]|nr:amidohydrolase family protein [Anaerolineae bacterium]
MEAIQGYTTGAAFASGRENRLGQLSPGFLADLLVLGTDPFACAPETLREIKPVAVMVDGDWKLKGSF